MRALKSAIVFTLVGFFILGAQNEGISQIQYGIKAGLNYGNVKVFNNGELTTESNFGIGANIGFILDYNLGKHRISSGIGLTIVNANFPEDYKKAFVPFLEIPIVYSYEILPKWRIGAGITNNFFGGIVDTEGSWQCAGSEFYYFGLIGEIEYSISENLSAGLHFKKIGAFNNKKSFSDWKFPVIGLDLKWKF